MYLFGSPILVQNKHERLNKETLNSTDSLSPFVSRQEDGGGETGVFYATSGRENFVNFWFCGAFPSFPEGIFVPIAVGVTHGAFGFAV